MATVSSQDWLEIITEKAALAKARKEALAHVKSEVKDLLRTPEKFRFEFEVRRTIRQHAHILIPHWRTLLASRRQPFERRLVIAKFLYELHNEAALDFIIETLRRGNLKECAEALSLHDVLDKAFPWPERQEEYFPLLLEQLTMSRQQLIPQAAWWCKSLGVPGAAQKAQSLWDDKLVPVARHRLAELLPVEAKTEAALTVLETSISKIKLPRRVDPVCPSFGPEYFDLSESLFAVTCFLDSPQPEVVQKAQELIYCYFPWKQLAREQGASGSWYPIIEDVGKWGGRAAVPLLERFARSKLNYMYRGFALKALAKVVRTEALPLIEEMLKDPEMVAQAVEALGLAFEGTGNADVVSRLKGLARTKALYVRNEVAEALRLVGGKAARTAARERIRAKDLSPWERPSIQALKKNATLTKTWSRLAKLGIAPKFSEEDVQRFQESEGTDRATPHRDWSLAILGHVRILVWFDAETGQVPSPHDYLIRDFAENSRNLFQPEAVYQGENKNKKAPVQFICQDRLYRFNARTDWDYYDIERTVGAINRALKDSGVEERFVEMETGDQTACYIFGAPRRIAVAAKEFQWPMNPKFNKETRARLLSAIKIE
jgi:hypothetical protein